MTKKFFLSLLSASIFITLLQAQAFKVMSYNIRHAEGNQHENAWEKRDSKVLSMLNYYKPDIIGLQEVSQKQFDFLNLQLPGYQYYGVGRDDGIFAGEYCPIYFKKNLFKLKGSGTFWLSEAPDVPGTRGWDAHIPRIASWVKLQHIKTKEEFIIFNTHFDHEGVNAREQSAWLLTEKVSELAEFTPAIVTGDFNCFNDSEPYRILTEDSLLLDARTVSEMATHGPESTFNGFDISNPHKGRIDYIFVKHPFQVINYAVLSDSWESGFPSDHFPVFTKVKLPAKK